MECSMIGALCACEVSALQCAPDMLRWQIYLYKSIGTLMFTSVTTGALLRSTKSLTVSVASGTCSSPF